MAQKEIRRIADSRQTIHTILQTGFTPRTESLRSCCTAPLFAMLVVGNPRVPKAKIRPPAFRNILLAGQKLGFQNVQTHPETRAKNDTLFLPESSQEALGLLLERAPVVLEQGASLAGSYLRTSAFSTDSKPESLAAGLVVLQLLCHGLPGLYGDLDPSAQAIEKFGSQTAEIMEHVRTYQFNVLHALFSS